MTPAQDPKKIVIDEVVGQDADLLLSHTASVEADMARERGERLFRVTITTIFVVIIIIIIRAP
jgi:phosphatidylglycerophosphatase A